MAKQKNKAIRKAAWKSADKALKRAKAATKYNKTHKSPLGGTTVNLMRTPKPSIKDAKSSTRKRRAY